MKRYFLPFLSFFLFIPYLYANERLIFAIDIIRHGDRTPLCLTEKLPHSWKEGLGQLTGKGMQQQLDLGSKLRKKYIEENNLLPICYQKDAIYIRSTDYDRTLMSAQSLLLGLYPPGTGPIHHETRKPALTHQLQPIPIHTTPTQQDELVNFHFNEPPLYALLEKHVFTREDWKKKTSQLQPKFKAWSEALGYKIESLGNIIMAGDLLHVHSLHQAPLPSALKAHEINEIIAEKNWIMCAIFSTPEVANASGGKTLKIVTQYLKDASEKKSPLKYVLISGHDTSILSIMGALGAPLDAIPPYASHLSFELYENDKQEHHVKVVYNDKPHEIPACGELECRLDTLAAMS